MKLNSNFMRSLSIASSIREKVDDSDLTITAISEKIWVAQPSLSRVLNGKVIWSDDLFVKLWKAIWLSDKKIEEIFEEADREFFRHKYGKDILSEREYSYDELFSMMKEKENLSDKQISAIQEYIELQKLKWNN